MFSAVMNSLSPFLLILSLLALFFLFMKMMRKCDIISNLPPSPPKLPIIGNLHQLGNLPHQNLCELSHKYGPAMLLKLGSIPTLVISSPHFAKQVLKDHDITFCSRPRSPGPSRIFYGCYDVAFSPYGDHWRNARKIFASHLMSPTRAESFSRARDREIGILIDYLSVSSLTTVNLDEKVFDFVNGVIGAVAFGKRFKGKQFEGEVLKDVMLEAMQMIDSFSVEDFFPLFGWVVDVLTGHKSKLDKCFRKLDGYLEMVLDEHLNGEKRDDEDLVDVLIALSNEENGLISCKEHVKAILMNALLGGVDTSSIVIVWAMSELTRNPRIMQKAQAEIRFNIHGAKPKVGADDLGKFTYLKMIVKETLRLHPPSPLLVPRESMHACQIRSENGEIYDIQAKTRVLINAWAIGRDPKCWQNPGEFYPERFDQNEIDFRGQHFEFVPFGGGRRICPSINNSIATIELTLANLLYWFDWKVPNGMKMEDVASLEEEGGVTTHKRTPLTLVPIKHIY